MAFNFRPDEAKRFRQIAKGATDGHAEQQPVPKAGKGVAYQAALEKLRRAPNLQVLLGAALLQMKVLKAIALFLLVVRSIKAGAQGFPRIGEMIQDSSSAPMADELAQKVITKITPPLPTSPAALSSAVTCLENKLGIDLIYRLEGIACDRVTDEGHDLCKLIEQYLGEYLQHPRN